MHNVAIAVTPHALLELLRTVSKLISSSLDVEFGVSNCIHELDFKIKKIISEDKSDGKIFVKSDEKVIFY